MYSLPLCKYFSVVDQLTLSQQRYPIITWRSKPLEVVLRQPSQKSVIKQWVMMTLYSGSESETLLKERTW